MATASSSLTVQLYALLRARAQSWRNVLRTSRDLQCFLLINVLATHVMILRLFQMNGYALIWFPFWMPLILLMLYGGAFFFMTLPAETSTMEGRALPVMRRPRLELLLILLYAVAFVNLGTWQLQHDWPERMHARALGAMLDGIKSLHQFLFGWLIPYRPGIANGYVLFAVPLLVLLALGNSARSLGFRMPTAPRWTLAAWGALFLLTVMQQAVTTSPARAAFAGLAGLLGAGLPEEFLYRAVIQTRLEALTGSPLRAIATTSLLFGAVHLAGYETLGFTYQLGNALGPKALIGLILGHCYYRTRSLWPCVLFHAALNVAYFARVA